MIHSIRSFSFKPRFMFHHFCQIKSENLKFTFFRRQLSKIIYSNVIDNVVDIVDIDFE